jgi:hypothetical protein
LHFWETARVPLIAEAEIVIERPVAEVFARFVDFGTWRAWMPASFAPLRGPARALGPGDRVLVRMGGVMVVPLRVLRVLPNRELSWRGGVPGVLEGEHTFVFEDLGQGKTRVRSLEPFSGALVRLWPVRALVAWRAGAIGREMLEGAQRSLT